MVDWQKLQQIDETITELDQKLKNFAEKMKECQRQFLARLEQKFNELEDMIRTSSWPLEPSTLVFPPSALPGFGRASSIIRSQSQTELRLEQKVSQQESSHRLDCKIEKMEMMWQASCSFPPSTSSASPFMNLRSRTELRLEQEAALEKSKTPLEHKAKETKTILQEGEHQLDCKIDEEDNVATNLSFFSFICISFAGCKFPSV